MKFVFAPDSFKGSLSASRIIDLLNEAAKEVFPDCETISVPMADGGEGTIDLILQCKKGKEIKTKVADPLFRKINSRYAVFDNVAVIEMAAASGLTLLSQQERNPLFTTSFGTGELILDAVERGYKNIYICLGGSATNDGGIGAMAALGAKFLDKNGNVLRGVGADLIKIDKIDISGINPKIKQVKFVVACDVNNTLTGKLGATYVYGAQKGADEGALRILEEGMKNYAKVIKRDYSVDIEKFIGGGAAGGLGAAIKFYLNAEFKSGIETMCELANLKEKIIGANLIITGEGEVNYQSAQGKVLSGIGKLGKENNIPVVAIVGSVGEGAQEIYKCGIDSIIFIINAPMSLEYAMVHAEELYKSAVLRFFKLVKAVQKIDG